jgi:hypothetical protein
MNDEGGSYMSWKTRLFYGMGSQANNFLVTIHGVDLVSVV